jgi:hypothetical protein
MSLPSVSEVDMSDQGWREFLAAENVGDWVVFARRSDGGVPGVVTR